ncbi:stimulated by retinoic acid gene 6 protein-like [Ptychodera flava]|uniref:stimulated by retinoic acid gene 6 protein-like n=1 Tax=Ptychodera flava TaxID=63121 RepID=UPI00396A6B9F
MLYLLNGLKTYLVDYSFVVVLYLIIGGVIDFATTFWMALEGFGALENDKKFAGDAANISISTASPVHPTTMEITTESSDFKHPLCLREVPFHELFPSILAVATILLYSFMTKRKNIVKDCCNGRPGLSVPVDLLCDHDDRLGYLLLFGASSILLFDLFRGYKYIDLRYVSRSPWFGVFVTALNVAMIGITQYPYYASIGFPNKLVGSTIGICYGGLMTIFVSLQDLFCGTLIKNVGPVEGIGILLYFLPIQTLWALVFIRYIIVIVWVVIARFRNKKKDPLSVFLSKSESIYVKHLFHKRSQERTPTSRIWRWCSAYCYKSVPGFKYSIRVLSTCVIAATCLLMLGVYEAFYLSKHVLVIEIYSNASNAALNRNGHHDIGLLWMDLVFNGTEVILLSSAVVATVATLGSMLKILANYRAHLLMLFRGDKSIIPTGGSPSGAMVSCLKYAGFQIGFLLWGFIVLQITFALLMFLIWYQIVLPIKHGITSDFFSRFDTIWPTGVLGGIIYLSQLALAKHLFLQEGGRTLGIDNRRLFHISSFFLIFYNVILGIFTCISRLFRSLVFGLLFLGRLDQASLPRSYELWDPGYRAYVGFLKVEEAHCHPVMITFCRLLRLSTAKQKENIKGTADIEIIHWRSCPRARWRWMVSYTLIRNPVLQLERSPLAGLLETVKIDNCELDSRMNGSRQKLVKI